MTTNPRMETQLSDLESVLGHTFRRPELLTRALTHRSLDHEKSLKLREEIAPADNERLEFLGDAVLGLVVAESLFASQPEWREGELTRARSNLINRRHMAEVASRLDLGRYLLLGQGEEHSGLRRHNTVLSNHMESVLGAMFIDGGLEPVRMFIRQHVMGEVAEKIVRELRSGAPLGNYKSALQQHLQAAKMGVPVYKLKHESSGDPNKRFLIEVRLKPGPGQKGTHLGVGVGRNKKNAEQDAARRALVRLTRTQAAQNAAAAAEETAAE